MVDGCRRSCGCAGVSAQEYEVIRADNERMRAELMRLRSAVRVLEAYRDGVRDALEGRR